MNEGNTTTRGRPAKPLPDTGLIIKSVIQFLLILVPNTLAKRIVGVILVAVGVPNDRITELTGMSERSIWRLRKAISSENSDEIFALGHGSGRPGNAKGFEREITEELGKNNYHTRQQVADMILEKFGVTMSVSAVGKLLKKTASGD
jgi:transposase